jgi:hypothetical protein
MPYDFADLLHRTPATPAAVLASVSGASMDEVVTIGARLRGAPQADGIASVRTALVGIVNDAPGSDAAAVLLADLAPLARNVDQMRTAMRLTSALAVLLPGPAERRRAVAERDAADTRRRRTLLSAIEQGLPLDTSGMDMSDRIEARFVMGTHRVRVTIEHRDETRTTARFDGMVAFVDGEPCAIASLAR